MNRRLILTLFATAALAGPLAGASVAIAKDQPRAQAQRGDRGGDRGGGGNRGGQNRNWERGDQGQRGQRRDDRGPAMRRDDDGDRGARAAPRSDYGPPPGYGAERQRSYGVRRGGYLPPQAPGYVVEDYGRYRLRPPPRGYDWVRVGDDFVLVAPDGQIFDMIRP